jgi:hypothetical protein
MMESYSVTQGVVGREAWRPRLFLAVSTRSLTLPAIGVRGRFFLGPGNNLAAGESPVPKKVSSRDVDRGRLLSRSALSLERDDG